MIKVCLKHKKLESCFCKIAIFLAFPLELYGRLGASLPKLQLILPALILLCCKYLWILNEYAKHTGHCTKMYSDKFTSYSDMCGQF